MEDNNIENQEIKIKLSHYLELRDKLNKNDEYTQKLVTYLMKGFELNSKNDIVFDKYNLDNKVMLELIKEVYPKVFKNISEILKIKEED